MGFHRRERSHCPVISSIEQRLDPPNTACLTAVRSQLRIDPVILQTLDWDSVFQTLRHSPRQVAEGSSRTAVATS